VSVPGRAEWIAALRTVLDITEAHPEIPAPAISTGIGGHTVFWWPYGDSAAAVMAALEQALPCELTASTGAGGNGQDRYVLTGILGGFKVEVSAPAEHVADLSVTREMTEKRVWARRPQAAEGEARS
jgi:hypothetical protein